MAGAGFVRFPSVGIRLSTASQPAAHALERPVTQPAEYFIAAWLLSREILQGLRFVVSTLSLLIISLSSSYALSPL